MFHGLPSCDFLVPTLYGRLSKLSAVLLQIGHALQNIDKFTTKGERKVAWVRRERSIFGWFNHWLIV